MPATTTADRLTFHWQPSFSPDYRLDVSVTERRPRAGDRVTRYKLDEIDAVDVGRVFLVAKDDDSDPAVYEVYVGPGVHCCTCPGAVGHRQNVTCKHVRLCRYAISEHAL